MELFDRFVYSAVNSNSGKLNGIAVARNGVVVGSEAFNKQFFTSHQKMVISNS